MALTKKENPRTILVIDDELGICEMLQVALKKWGYRSVVAHNFKDGLKAMERARAEVILSDIKLPDGSGVEFLEKTKFLPEKPPLILMTAFGDTDSAVRAMKLGAYHYVTKPFKLEELKVLIERAIEQHKLQKENATLKNDVKNEYAPTMIGKAKSLKSMQQMIERVGKTKTGVLITGESGTGKELVARAIHYGGVLKNKPFVVVNCGAIPETLIESELFGHKKGSFTGAVNDKDGLFRVADSGTIFLDEIGELPLTMQVKLLRVLQDRTFRPVGGTEDIKVDVRVVCATNRNLEEEVRLGKFREDLFYRLNVIQIKTPPLRDRKEDIPELVQHFLRKFSLAMGKGIDRISDQTLEALMNYEFPGNIRELENMMERAVALEGSDEVTLESLPAALRSLAKSSTDGVTKTKDLNKKSKDEGWDWSKQLEALDAGKMDLEAVLEDLERALVLKALEKNKGVKKKAAASLGITFRSIRYRCQKLGIEDGDDEASSED